MKLWILLSIIVGLFTVGVTNAETPPSFKITAPMSLSRMKDGSLREITGKEGYHVELINTVGATYIVKIYDEKGKRIPGMFTVASSDVDNLIQEQVETGLFSLENGMVALPPECKDVVAPAPQDLLSELSDTIAKGFGAYEKSKPAGETCALYAKFKGKVPDAPLKQALTFFHKNKNKFANQEVISIADYSKNSKQKRFYLLDLTSGDVTLEKVSHGSGTQNGVKRGDPNADGMIDRCTYNGSRKNMTRAGFFRVEDYYLSGSHVGKWPYLTSGKGKYSAKNGMRLEGLSPGVNEEANGAGVVMHEAYYNSGGNAIMGRSYGCPAFVPGRGKPMLAKMRGGSMYYSYVPACKNEMKKVIAQVDDWENLCKGMKPPKVDKPVKKMTDEEEEELAKEKAAIVAEEGNSPEDEEEDTDEPAPVPSIKSLPKPSKNEPVINKVAPPKKAPAKSEGKAEKPSSKAKAKEAQPKKKDVKPRRTQRRAVEKKRNSDKETTQDIMQKAFGNGF